jgi:hypothetical protein
MPQLTSTVPAAFDALVDLVTAAAPPGVFVAESELVQYEPATYVELTTVANHTYQVASLGTYAFYENYEIQGVVRVFRGDYNPREARTDAWAAYQSIVVSTVIANKTLGDLVLAVELVAANSTCEITANGGTQCLIEFAVALEARLTV